MGSSGAKRVSKAVCITRQRRFESTVSVESYEVDTWPISISNCEPWTIPFASQRIGQGSRPHIAIAKAADESVVLCRAVFIITAQLDVRLPEETL